MSAALVVMISGIGMAGPAAALPQTYDVTSTSMCGGAGTFEQAVKDANANPGPDTISIAAGLRIDVSTCYGRVPGFDYGVNATGSVTIQANGATFVGGQFWTNVNGIVNDPNMCPGAQGTRANWMQISTGFLLIGASGADNTGVTVTVTGAHFDGLPSLVETTGGASFTMIDSAANKTIDFMSSCARPPIAALDGGTITLVNSRIERSVLPGRRDVSALISTNSADVVLDRVSLLSNSAGAAVRTVSGRLTVVSSTLGDTGGLWLGADSRIVNTVFFSSGDKPTDRLVAAGGTTRAQGSTFYWLNPVCPTCDPGGAPGVGFRTTPVARFALESSAVGANLFSDPFGPPVSGPLLPDNPAHVTTDAVTWVQPTANQDAAALAALVPSSLTSAPGLLANANPYATYYVDAVTPLLGSPVTPGVLVDAVPDAVCPGGANALVNPIDSTCIVTDAFGKPRWDAGNSKRNIGAVQNVHSPFLAVSGTGDQQVALAWNRPTDPASGPVTGYQVGYRIASSADPYTTIEVPGADTLTADATGLANGTTYEFYVVARTATDAGPESNHVTATPFGPVGTPTVGGTGGDGSVQLFWDVTTGGHPTPFTYSVVYRPVGTTAWITGPASLSGRITLITGLSCRTTYEFGVLAVAADGSGSGLLGTTTVSTINSCPIPPGPVPPPGPTPAPAPTTSPTTSPTATPTASPTSSPTPTPTGTCPAGGSISILSPRADSPISSGGYFGVTAATSGIPAGTTATLTLDGISVATAPIRADGQARFQWIAAHEGGYAVRICPGSAGPWSASFRLDIRPFGITRTDPGAGQVTFTIGTGYWSPGQTIHLTRDGRSHATVTVVRTGTPVTVRVANQPGTYQVRVSSRQGLVYGLKAGVTTLR